MLQALSDQLGKEGIRAEPGIIIFSNMNQVQEGTPEYKNVHTRMAIDASVKRGVKCKHPQYFYYRMDHWSFDENSQERTVLLREKVEKAIRSERYAHNPGKVRDPFWKFLLK